MFKKRISYMLTLAALSLMACGGGGDGGGSNDGATTDPTPSPAAPTPRDNTSNRIYFPPVLGDNALRGTIVYAETNAATTARLASDKSLVATQSAGCINVPAGYLPVPQSGLKITFLDAQKASVGTATPNACSLFELANKPATAVSARIEASGFITQEVDIATFGKDGSQLVTLLTSKSDPKIAMVTPPNNLSKELNISLIDATTGKAIELGSINDIKIVSAGKTISPEKPIIPADPTPTSVGLVMDASGSMFQSFNHATLATHTFVDYKAPTTEIALTIFDQRINFIDDTFLDKYTFVDQAGQTHKYTFSADGFTKELNKIRFPIDLYNYTNSIWSNVNKTTVPTPNKIHQNSPNWVASQGTQYIWGNATAFYGAAALTMDKLIARTTDRKFIIAMTDGQDNASQILYDEDQDTIVKKSLTSRIPINIVGYNYTSDTLKTIADKTGGFYLHVTGSNIVNSFDAYQSAIVHQAKVVFKDPVDYSKDVTLTINVGGKTVTRTIYAK